MDGAGRLRRIGAQKEVLAPGFILGEFGSPVDDISKFFCPFNFIFKHGLLGCPGGDDAVNLDALAGNPLDPFVEDGAAVTSDDDDEVAVGEMSDFCLIEAEFGAFGCEFSAVGMALFFVEPYQFGEIYESVGGNWVGG